MQHQQDLLLWLPFVVLLQDQHNTRRDVVSFCSQQA
jgi:hypothetical protein